MFDETNLKSAQKGALITSISIIVSLVIYALLVEFYLGKILPGEKISLYGTLRYVLMAVAAVEVILVVILRNLILSGKIKSKDGLQQPGGQEESPADREEEFIRRLRLAHIVTYALCDAIAIFGLLLFILGKDKTEFYAFLGIAFFLMMVNFPKYDDWKGRLENYLSNY